jgi:hypothetical protein
MTLDYTTGSAQLSGPELEEMKNWVRGLLHDENIKDLRITFTKADGASREMRCTLVENSIPGDKAPKGTGRPTSDEAQPVFDLDKGEWRSFRWDSITGVNFTME